MDSGSSPKKSRTELHQELCSLPSEQFDALLIRIQPPDGLIAGNAASQMVRANQLLVWAEGSTGRGTDEIWDALAQLQQGSLSSQGQALPNFQPYLQSILENEDYREWQECYTPTTVEGRKPAPQPERSRRLKLRVETVVAKDDSANGASTKPSEGEPQEKIEQFEVLEGLRQYAADHVLLVGKPGSGKSSSLEWLLWNEAGRALDDPTAKIPVLVKLRRCTSTPEALIQDFLNGHGLPLSLLEVEALLRQGKLLLLLDGLNELPANLSTEMANFRSRYRQTTPMVVSTREQSIGGTLGITKTLKMLPLSEPQMQEFVQGYLGDEGKALFQQIKGDHLRKFAETPLLLWMLCRVFDQNGHVPSNLGMAFREFTQLYDRHIQEDAPAESRDQWPKLLRHLAFALMHDKELVDFRLSMPREEAENVLTTSLQQEGRSNARENAERWLQDLLDYHLIQPVIKENLEEHIEFRHQLIQEYYAAEYLLRNIPELSNEQLKRDYLNLLKWTEPLALMLALLNDESQALRIVKLAINDLDWVLGARLAGSVQEKFQTQTTETINQVNTSLSIKIELLNESKSIFSLPILISQIKNEDPLIQVQIIKALDKFDRKIISQLEIGTFLKDAAQDADPLIRQSAKSLLEDIGQNDFTPSSKYNYSTSEDNYSIDDFIMMILEQLSSKDDEVRWNAAIMLGEINDDRSAHQLIDALRNGSKVFRYKAALALSKNKTNEAVQALINALDDEDLFVRRSAAYALGKNGNEAALPSLLDLTVSQENFVREMAVFAIGEIGKEEMVSPLASILDKASAFLRGYIAEAIGKIGSHNTLTILVNLANDPSPFVREMAIQAIGNFKDLESKTLLMNSLSDKNRFVRRRALTALSEVISDGDSLSFEILKDEDSVVRMNAISIFEAIADDISISKIFNTLQDKDVNVRDRAIRALKKLVRLIL
jgi:HEAT repeat protein